MIFYTQKVRAHGCKKLKRLRVPVGNGRGGAERASVKSERNPAGDNHPGRAQFPAAWLHNSVPWSETARVAVLRERRCPAEVSRTAGLQFAAAQRRTGSYLITKVTCAAASHF